VCIYIYIYIYILACTRYCFTPKIYCGNQSSVYCPSPTCKAYPIAILLHDHCAMYAPPPTHPFYVIHDTILVIEISCKGQRAPSFVDAARCERANLSCFFQPLAPACDATPSAALHVDVRTKDYVLPLPHPNHPRSCPATTV